MSYTFKFRLNYLKIIQSNLTKFRFDLMLQISYINTFGVNSYILHFIHYKSIPQK